jgi:hypothetical protein
MKMDLEQMNHFFANYQKTPMPEVVRSLTLSGSKIIIGELETSVIEWRSLRDIFSPEIAQKIDVNCTGMNIPVLRRIQTPEHFVYDPRTGEYLGQFDVE